MNDVERRSKQDETTIDHIIENEITRMNWDNKNIVTEEINLSKCFCDFDIKKVVLMLGYNSFEDFGEKHKHSKHGLYEENMALPDWNKIGKEELNGSFTKMNPIVCSVEPGVI